MLPAGRRTVGRRMRKSSTPKRIRGCFDGDANPSEFIQQLRALHAQGKFPMEALVRRYDSGDIEAARRLVRI
jgi:Zn-dependent alcohol dehydrogenase